MRWFFLVYNILMKADTIIKEIAFEKNCTLRKATEIYRDYKRQGRVEELTLRLKYHKEV